MILAELLPTLDWSSTGQWFLGFLGVMAVVSFGLSIIANYRKVFGRRPPVDEELNKIREAARTGNAALWRETREIRAAIDQRFSDLAIERQRTLESLYDKGINPLREDVHRILGILEEKNRK